MDRDEAFTRRVAESATSESTEDSAEDEEQTYAVREGAVRSADAEELVTRDDGTTAAIDAARIESQPTSDIDHRLERPPDLRESVDIADVALDGSAIRGGLTSPTGETIGGSSPADELGLGGGALGGSRLDPLGLLGGTGQTAGRTGGPGSGLQGKDGSAVSSGGPGSDEHFNTVNEMRGGSGLPDLTRDEYNSAFGIGGSGGGGGGAMDTGGGGDSRGVMDSVGGFGISDAAWRAAEEFHTENVVGWVNEYGAAEVFPADDDDKSAAEEIQEGLHDSYTNFGSDDEDVEDEEKPDPNAGYDVVTGANVEAAIRVQGIAPYAQPTQDDDSSGAMTSVNLDWAAPGSDPRLTQYGPDGPQTVEGGTWAPPSDLIFDPPPEGASAGMAGAGAAMDDPGAALGGASMIGSSTPDDAPPPPDPPPGDDPDQGPLGPPGGGGGEG